MERVQFIDLVCGYSMFYLTEQQKFPIRQETRKLEKLRSEEEIV